MPINRPFTRELQQAIDAYLQQPDADARVDRYSRRIIQHLQGVLAREQALGDAYRDQESDAMAALRVLFDSQQAVKPDQAANDRLCAYLEQGNLDALLPALLRTLLPLAEAKLAIDSPRYPR